MMCGMAASVMAQEDVNLLSTRATSLARKYLRPSLTRVYLVDGSANARTAVQKLMEVDERNQKFDKNQISDYLYNIGVVSGTKENRDAAVKAYIEKAIEQNKLGSQVMKNFFPEFKDGAYSVEKLFERGQFAATDNDVLQNNASARQSLMFELGEQLIDRSYMIFYLIQDDKEMNKNPRKDGSYPTYVDVIPYVYKMNFNEEVRNDFYTNYYSVPDGIDQCNFPMSFIMNAQSGVSAEAGNIDEDEDEKLFTIMRKVSDFQVKTAVMETHPIRAKIGKKEGVHCDKRYVVMENRLDKNQNTYAKRIATVRATNHVVDNYSVATGHQEDLTSFYYIKGGHVQPGMTIVENPDFGVSITPQYNIAGIGASLDYRIGQLLGVPGLLFSIEGGLVMNEDGKVMKVRGVTNKETLELTDIAVMNFGLGLAKEFNFAHNFSFTPSVSAGVLWPIGAKKISDVRFSNGYVYYNVDTDKSSMDSYYITGAVKLGYYVIRNIQLFAEAGYNLNILGDEFKAMRDIYAANEGKDAKDPMALRLGGGLRIYF